MKSHSSPDETPDSIVLECTLDEPREKVWRALTVPEIVAEWLTADSRGNADEAATPKTKGTTPREDFEPRDDFVLSPPKQASKPLDAAQLEVISAERPERIQYRWREGDRVAVESTVTFELSDSPEGGTHLRITHEDFEFAEETMAVYQPIFVHSRAQRRRARRAINRRAARTRVFCSLRTPLLRVA